MRLFEELKLKYSSKYSSKNSKWREKKFAGKDNKAFLGPNTKNRFNNVTLIVCKRSQATVSNKQKKNGPGIFRRLWTTVGGVHAICFIRDSL